MSRRGQPPREVIHAVEPICSECGKMAIKTTGASVYPHRPDLAVKVMYLCECGAYVGTHPGTDIPLGYPAGPATRAARLDAHAVFDALWRAKMQTVKEDGSPYRKHEARAAGYSWLSAQLGLPPAETHIGMFNAATARKVVALCAPIVKRINARVG